MSHYSPVVAALVTMLLTIIILMFSKFGKEIQDIPNERSLHETPVPRIGGVAMMAGLLCGLGVDGHVADVVDGAAADRIVHRLPAG